MFLTLLLKLELTVTGMGLHLRGNDIPVSAGVTFGWLVIFSRDKAKSNDLSSYHV